MEKKLNYCFNNHLFFISLFLTLTVSFPSQANNSFTIKNNKRTLHFDSPVEKIITLSPHATELTNSAGAFNKILATVTHSDFPEDAQNLPRIGDAHSINIETIIMLNPDVIIAWHGGNNKKQLAQLEKLGFKIYHSKFRNLEDIADDIRNIGKMANTQDISDPVADNFISIINSLKFTHSNKKKIQVFYQIWHAPLMTINKTHFINDIISLCGGVNIFSDIIPQIPLVSIEAILNANPDVIVAGSKNSSDQSQLAFNWIKSIPKSLSFTPKLLLIDPDLLHRPTTRIAQGAETLCNHLDDFRNKS